MSTTAPITPKEAEEYKLDSIPSQIFEAVNFLIKQHYKAHGFSIKQSDILEKALELANEDHMFMTSNMIFEKGWMDFEPHYRNAGWKVVHDKPGYNESYPAVFKFSKQ